MLKYLGNGFLPGIPARDLTDPEAEQFGREDLIRSGLYAEPETQKAAIMEAENKLLKGKMSNKEASDE